MRENFSLLLKGFMALARRGHESDAAQLTRIRTLLTHFAVHRKRAYAFGRVQAAEDLEHIDNLLKNYNKTVKHYRQQQEETADDFNLLDVMQVSGKEMRHSMMLAWLLDHEIRKHGTHAQGNLGFRLFLEEFGLPTVYATDCKYWVRREVAGNESIVDVEIVRRVHFLIHIENKIWSGEGKIQTDREWADIQRRAEVLKVSTRSVHALFLTPIGTKPENANFQAITWGRIVRVLEIFAEQAKPPDVKLFARHYMRALKRFSAEHRNEEENAERTHE